jgi:hypothetical protein
MPAISDGCRVNALPCGFGHPHCFELIDLIDLSRGYALIIEIDSLMEELGPVMTFEASDYALVKWLNMGGKIWLEVFNSDILEIRGNNMAREIVLEK